LLGKKYYVVVVVVLTLQEINKAFISVGVYVSPCIGAHLEAHI